MVERTAYGVADLRDTSDSGCDQERWSGCGLQTSAEPRTKERLELGTRWESGVATAVGCPDQPTFYHLGSPGAETLHCPLGWKRGGGPWRR
ncbi:hypothetical protein NDU88_006169 [Pleurodeles waltl]|uniref:Uncharacterized protein n=1 Tax=Pleurodeles waltl TaxID=8319 RepID=A0AAV7QNE7_PLEWA|nr:hypothetical protein NDU88_006169 [Pleurodeles waltl]